MADNNLTTITASSLGVTGYVAVADPVNGSVNVPISNSLAVPYTAGAGNKQINQATSGQVQLAPASNCTINFNTGAVTGGNWTIGNNTQTSLKTPDNVTFTTTALKDFQLVFPTTSGASSINVYPGSSNGWNSLFPGSSTFPLRGGPGGGGCKLLCSDSIGWTVSASAANFVINNADGSNSATLNFYFAGI